MYICTYVCGYMLRPYVHHEGVYGSGDAVPHIIVAVVGGEWSRSCLGRVTVGRDHGVHLKAVWFPFWMLCRTTICTPYKLPK